MSDSNRAIALAFFDHLYAGNLDGALDLLASDAQYVVLGRPENFPMAGSYGKDQIVDLLELIGPAVPNGVQQEITSSIAEGDRVAVIGHVEAVAANGRDYRNNFVFIVTVRDGSIIRVDEYIDTQEANDVLFSD